MLNIKDGGVYKEFHYQTEVCSSYQWVLSAVEYPTIGILPIDWIIIIICCFCFFQPHIEHYFSF